MAHSHPDIDAAAWLVASELMRHRSGSSRAYELWAARARAETELSPQESRLVEVFVQPSIGLEGQPAPTDHLEGCVAEYVWYLLARDSPEDGRVLNWIERPGFAVTDSGGDGLAIYERDDGTLIFRLWEIKKHTGGNTVSATLSAACSQLARNGAAYLARYVGTSGHQPHSRLGDFYSLLVERWIASHETAGAGVAISTSDHQAPKRAFIGMHRHFPHLIAGDQLEGLIAAVGDFPEFAIQVRRYLWTGL
jgi:hypothetical protein